MISIGQKAAAKALEILSSSGGLTGNIAVLSAGESNPLPAIPDKQIFLDNASSELAEKSGEARYTALYIYCEKIANTFREKFRSFSGHVQLAVEVRLSQDRLEGIDKKVQIYADAVSQTLSKSRGDWSQGLFYGGGYEITLGPIKHGGRNFIKSAKISLQVDASVD